MNPVLALIITNIIWGGASPIFKFALQNIPPFTLAFIRFFFASLLFLPSALKNWQKISLKDFFEIFLLGFFGIFINITFFFLGLKKTESINAPIIASSAPIFTFIFSILFLREKPKSKVFFGMLISFIGVLVIIFSPLINLKNNQLIFTEIKGNLFILMATFGYVISTIIGKKINTNISSFLITFLSFFLNSFLFLLFIPNELKNWSFNDLNLNGWLGIVYGIFFSSALAYFLYYYSLKRIDGQEIGIFTYIDPVVAVIIAIPLLNEIPNLYYLIGSFFVFLGIYIAENRIHWHPFHRLKNK